ncbi:MAG TPA: hypothetical protein DCL48_09030 [Alphaproteobacteria bacterium]|nr:hypothetical protein [Alphaproteobacteria bacterium]
MGFGFGVPKRPNYGMGAVQSQALPPVYRNQNPEEEYLRMMAMMDQQAPRALQPMQTEAAKAQPQASPIKAPKDRGMFGRFKDFNPLRFDPDKGVGEGNRLYAIGAMLSGMGAGDPGLTAQLLEPKLQQNRERVMKRDEEAKRRQIAESMGLNPDLAGMDLGMAMQAKYRGEDIAREDERLGKEDAWREKMWLEDKQRYETEQERLARLEARGILESDRNYSLDARLTTAAEAAAAARGEPKETARYLSADELKAAGYPEGSVVQRKADGTDDVRYKPNAEYSAGEISGFRNKANTLADFQRNLNAYKAAVEKDGTITFYGANNKKAGNLDGLHQALIFGAKDLLSLGILSKDDYENLNKLIPDATGMGTLGQGKEALMAKLAPLEATINSQLGMIPEQYRSGSVQTPAETSAAPKGPAPGTVKNGYRFKGGNPNDKNNWEPV